MNFPAHVWETIKESAEDLTFDSKTRIEGECDECTWKVYEVQDGTTRIDIKPTKENK